MNNEDVSPNRYYISSRGFDLLLPFLTETELIAKSLNQQLPDCLFDRIIWVQRIRREYITMEKRRAAQPTLVVRFVYDTMLRALVRSAAPPHDHISAIDHIHVLDSFHRNPFLFVVEPYLKAVLVRFLKKHRHAAEVSVRANTELARERGGERRVADHFHHDHGLFSESVHDGDRVAKALEEDLPYRRSEVVCCLVVVPYRGAELVLWQWWPDVGTVEAGVLDHRVFATNVESLDLL